MVKQACEQAYKHNHAQSLMCIKQVCRREAVQELFQGMTWDWMSDSSHNRALANEAPAQFEAAPTYLQNLFLLLKLIAVAVAILGV